MPKYSAGLALYRQTTDILEVLIIHPGGPFWAKKDLGAWSFPKGEYLPEEDPLSAAKREFQEELGTPPPDGDYQDLGEVKQPSGKLVHIWALAADFDTKHFKSNSFAMEWPPRSGTMQQFPEADKAVWTPLPLASRKLTKGQVPFLERLAEKLGISLQESPDAHKADNTPQTSLF